jgi:hypothetical protein
MMAWVKLDDQFSDHPKAAEAGPLGIAMQVAGLCYCNRHLTDGFISRAVAARLLDFTGLAIDLDADEPDMQVMGFKINWYYVVERLENAGLWEACDGGWMIHDYLEYNPSKADAVAKRDDIRSKRTEAGRKGLAKRWQSDSKPIANEDQNDSPNPNPNPIPSSLHSEGTRRARNAPAYTPDFLAFYTAYPKHENKKAAQAEWNRINPGPELIALIMAAVEQQKGGRKWQEGFANAPDVWLRGAKWEDEPEPIRSSNGHKTQADHNQLQRNPDGTLRPVY